MVACAGAVLAGAGTAGDGGGMIVIARSVLMGGAFCPLVDFVPEDAEIEGGEVEFAAGGGLGDVADFEI